MAKEFFGVRTEFKDDLRRAKGILGLPTLTDTFEAIMRSIANPHLPQSASILKALERKEKPGKCCLKCVREKCGAGVCPMGGHKTRASAEKAGMCTECRTCSAFTTTPKGAAKS